MTTIIKEKLIDKLPGAGANSQSGPDMVSQNLLKQVSGMEKSAYLGLLESHDTGLSETEVEEKLEKFGPNEVLHEKAPAWYLQLLSAFANPFIVVLLLLATISFIMDVVMQQPQDRD